MRCSRLVTRFFLAAGLVFAGRATAGPDIGIQLTGVDFAGGAHEKFGADKFGEAQVNYVYAKPTGAHSSMKAAFDVARVPDEPQFLHLKAMDDDQPEACRIEIRLNGRLLLEGRNPFPADRWQVHRIAVPAGVLRKGANELVVANVEENGAAGMPPWFMVASCGIGGEALVLRRDLARDFFFTLPKEKRPLPEPLPAGAEPGFKIRGIKGWFWKPEQYLAEIPVLKQYKMNFMMNCYGSMFSKPDKWENNWWEPMPEDRKEAYGRVIRACREAGIQFCFSKHPQLSSSRPIDPTRVEDFEKLWPHFAWAQEAGAEWFNLPLDDVHVMKGVKIDGSEHAQLINRLYGRLLEKDKRAQFIFCPTWYWGDGSGGQERAYLEALARDLHPDVYLFWTGDAVVGQITRKAAEIYRGFAKHRIILWDNYPVNDGAPTLHLGPVTGREPDLNAVIDGYMSNPLCPQNEANRIPLLTCADYAFNPAAYDPERSIGQAILHLADTAERQQVLKDLVEAYPGMLIYKQGTGFNPVRHQYTRLASAAHSRFAAQGFIRQVEGLSARMKRAFPDRFEDARRTVDADVDWMKRAFAGKYGG
ncbi:MAG TPA: beta-N-acetylglucosaminidase domain-containing protein [Phycisphaerae bacterium]|nr:beta-N-acetylglucosaminidase domain-containing protein [Phycisphaerae bacterium]HRY70169.1 beta-N-acetylglucosaminidase domain-containing protein [Phycisphaerae bacterium]HSA27384.1 beta-N-acetylglucosaminidase domain-containing protein [Phycisphaerae bacterium]